MRKPTTRIAQSMPGLLFWAALACASVLVALVVIAPWLDGASRLVQLFATDTAVRRSALGSAVGLIVTAFVFFRGDDDDDDRPGRRARKAMPQRVIGA